MNQPYGYFQLTRHLDRGKRIFCLGKPSYDKMGDHERQEFLHLETDPAAFPIELERADVLVGKGYFSTEKNDHPAQMKPDKEKGQGGKTAVDSIVFGNEKLEINVGVLKRLVKCPGDEPGQNSRAESNLGIGHQQVDEAEQHPDDEKRQQLEKEIDQRTDTAQQGDFIDDGKR